MNVSEYRLFNFDVFISLPTTSILQNEEGIYKRICRVCNNVGWDIPAQPTRIGKKGKPVRTGKWNAIVQHVRNHLNSKDHEVDEVKFLLLGKQRTCQETQARENIVRMILWLHISSRDAQRHTRNFMFSVFFLYYFLEMMKIYHWQRNKW